MKEAALQPDGEEKAKTIGEMERKYREAEKLKKEMEERVEVYDGEHIKVRWKFEERGNMEILKC